MFEIILQFNLKSAFSEWRSTARAMKRHQLALLDLKDRCAVNTKRAHFTVWMRNYKKTHMFNKALRRYN